MPVSGGGFEQCYNAQAGSPISLPPLVPCAAASAVEVESRLIVQVIAALGRERHGRRVCDLEKKADPPAPEPHAPWSEEMAHRVATQAGRARYKLRQQTVEPIFGIIKAALGFRSFRRRGLAGAATEWTLVTLACNLRRLHRLGAELKTAPTTA